MQAPTAKDREALSGSEQRLVSPSSGTPFPSTVQIRILNVFHRLMPSGAEVMWLQAADHFNRERIEHVIVSVDPEPGPFAATLSEKFEIVHLPLAQGPAGWRQIAGVATRSGAALIHCHSESKGMAAAFAGRRLGVPVVRTYHNIWRSRTIKHRIRRYVEARLCTRVAVGESVRDTERFWGAVRLIQNWASPPFRKQNSPVPEQIRLVTVCNTNLLKRCDRMLSLVATEPSLDLTHIGMDQAGEFALEKRVRAGVQDRVRTLGPQADAAARLRDFDAYMCTSELEGFSIALCEASLCGLPLAVLDRPGVRDIFRFCPHAYKIREDPIEPLRGFRESLRTQADWYSANLETLIDAFSPTRGAAEYAALYRELVTT